jgi:hypothetical protein
MAAWSWTQSMVAVRTPGAVSLLLGHKWLFGSHSAVYHIPQQDCVIAEELAVDAHDVVVRRWSLTKGSFS